jgi:uncharacterized membrane protein YgdD (TMEM256/DUF423 family)
MSQWIAIGAVNAFVSVAAGAFGAHALRARLEPRMLEVFETGARYQMFHAIGLVLIGLFLSVRPAAPLGEAAGWSMLAGILLFSGSLYAMALSGVKVLGAITPFGGVAFLVGWALLAASAVKSS